MTQPSSLTPHRVIAERMKELRKKRGWSAAHLAQEMKKAGIPWDRSIVASLELGRRATVTVEELLALSFVLSVAPVHLLVPPVGVDDKTPYQVVPNGPGSPDPVLGGSAPYPAVVRAWVRGQLPMGDMRSYFEEVPPSELAPPDEFGGAWRVVATGESADGER
ncbi:helix-turn-helix domain-containing protein [Micromonospora sp. NPDC049175]|uniref:helix-turn-helix domain-containing protein n=1 Tax=Micromonospora sp. NPDC049175 TaxID=3364266 RepID=UPI00371F8496